MARDNYIQFGNSTSNRVELGIINTISDTLSITTSIPKIPMLKAEEQIGMDTGATNSISLISQHINGDTLTNAQWMNKMISLINRWQSETNGNRFKFTPDLDASSTTPAYDENVFISSITFKWNAGNPEVISATTSMKVGSMTGPVSYSGLPPVVNMRIKMTDKNGTWHDLCYRDGQGMWHSAVQSLELTGGFDQPFESIVMKVPRRDLATISSAFTQADSIRVGNNIIELNGAMGWGRYIISSVKSNNSEYTINAYSVAEMFKSQTLPQSYGAERTFKEINETYIEVGISIPTDFLGQITGSITYTNLSGNTVTVNLSGNGVSSHVAQCKLIGGYALVSISTSTPTPSRYSLVQWSDGDSNPNRQNMQLTTGTSYGCKWKFYDQQSGITDYTEMSTPPTVEPGVVDGSTVQQNFVDYSPYTPLEIIKSILASGVNYPVGNTLTNRAYSESNPTHNGKLIIHTSSGDSANWGQRDCYFPESMNAWYVLQLCAYAMNCKIHFSDGDCYLTGYNYITNTTHPAVNLTSQSNSQTLLNAPTLGSFEAEDIINTISFKYGTLDNALDADDETSKVMVIQTGEVYDSASVNYYGILSSNKTFQGIRSTNVTSENIAKAIANAMIRFSKAGGQSITFEVIESENGQWVQRYGNESFPASITDEINGTSMTTTTPMGTNYITLGLRTYTRYFPQCITKYSFGPQNPTNLALKVSTLETSVNNQ